MRLKFPLFILLTAAYTNGQPARWEFQGFWENRGYLYFRVPHQEDSRAEGDSHVQWKTHFKLKHFSCTATPELWIDSRHQIDRRSASLSDRTDQRPALGFSELYLDVPVGNLDLRIGKQQIIWGRADGWNPTDNVTSFDYLDLIDNERLGTTAVRVRRYFGSSSLDLVWTPLFTPTRLPLLHGRWFPLPQGLPTFPVAFRSSVRLPPSTFANSQFAARWDRTQQGWDYSLSYFKGWNDLAAFTPTLSNFTPLPSPSRPVTVDLARSFRRLEVMGGDFAATPHGIGVRGEMAFFRPESKENDSALVDDRNYMQYALGADKHYGEWFLLGEILGDSSFGHSQSNSQAGRFRFPDRGLGHSLLGRVERTINPWSSFRVTTIIRFSGHGFLLQPAYQYQVSQAWKAEAGILILGGNSDDFLGQYRDNTRLYVKLRKSF
ncbi:MAG TPA: DUF1302 family protein [Acidobacteriota bacterium]